MNRYLQVPECFPHKYKFESWYVVPQGITDWPEILHKDTKEDLLFIPIQCVDNRTKISVVVITLDDAQKGPYTGGQWTVWSKQVKYQIKRLCMICRCVIIGDLEINTFSLAIWLCIPTDYFIYCNIGKPVWEGQIYNLQFIMNAR